MSNRAVATKIPEQKIPESIKTENRQALSIDESPEADGCIDASWNVLHFRNGAADSRLVNAGKIIPAQYYADQPYIAATGDGAWLCVLTTGAGHEGNHGQHIVSMRSEDQGQSWSAPVCIESPDGPEASWGVPLASPSGRIYVFYVYNADDIRELPADKPDFKDGFTTRMDSHGYYVFRWSDDHGRTWSKQRVTLPVREFAIDRNNTTHGKVRLFWNVGRPLITGNSVFLTLHKVGGFGDGWFTQSEGALLRSDDLLGLDDPAKATWITLPDGDAGLRTPPGGGPIAEEHSLIELSDGSLFIVYRSIDGHPVGSYSRDKGHTWSEPRYLEYADGRRVKHPRAACFAWKLKQGGYVLWFHNHGGAALGKHPARRSRAYEDRNPVWITRGREIQTPRGLELGWENPEIVLYDDDPIIRMSYPDLKEEGAKIYVTETQKAVARVHQLDARLAHALRDGTAGFSGAELWREATLDWTMDSAPVCLPDLPVFLTRCTECPYGSADQRAGFSIELEFHGEALKSSAVLAEAWQSSYGGVRLEWLSQRRLKLTLSDGRCEFSWSSDVRLLNDGLLHHIIIVVDGGPKIISFFVDGVFCDGGDKRQFGWGRFTPYFRGLPARVPLSVTEEGAKSLRGLRIYPRAFLAAEAGALFLAASGRGCVASGPL
ncbi:MAG: exo-alpha-sialidase [Chthoniobacteraceae bacterium]